VLEEKLPGFLARIPEGDMDAIRQPLDFFGFNYYFGRVGDVDEKGRWKEEPPAPGAARTFFDWPLHPRGMYWASRFFFDEYQLPLYVFENGLSSMDWVDADETVQDPQRIDFLTRHLREFSKAHQDGVELAGYFHWSLMDNFEWAQGYRERFGLIHVDYQSQKRTLKASAHWYRQVIEGNGRCLREN
jgi:beta-glucosidase